VGLLSWFNTTASKSTAAALVQSAFEPLANAGLFQVNPTTLASRVVEGAFTRVPKLASANYNRHVLAVATLTMVPALPAFSPHEREASKHALGFLLKHVLELQMSNAVALTMSEQNILEQAQITFLATTQQEEQKTEKTPNQNAIAFAEQDMTTLQNRLKQTATSLGVSLTIRIESPDGFAGAAIGIDAPKINFKGEVVVIQSYQETGKSIEFCVLSLPDLQPYGPEPLYATMYEALLYADIFLKRMVESLTELHAKRQAEQCE
jgi:hypothetical protein